MSSLKQLKLVADIEHKKAQHCANQYQQANAHVQQNQQKLAGLERYRLDYLHGIRKKAALGIEAMKMNQHHQFIGQLDKACEQQVHVISQSILVADQRKRQWMVQQQKQRAIEHLIAKKQKLAALKANKQEQKMFDELASQQYQARLLKKNANHKV